MGRLEMVIKHNFRAASSCEGGMLKGAGGRGITPEGYIASWLSELANPIQFSERQITLQVGSGYNASSPEDLFEKVKVKLSGAK